MFILFTTENPTLVMVPGTLQWSISTCWKNIEQINSKKHEGYLMNILLQKNIFLNTVSKRKVFFQPAELYSHLFIL